MSAAFLDARRAASATPRSSFREGKCFSADSPTPSSSASFRRLTKVTSGGGGGGGLSHGGGSVKHASPQQPTARTPLLPASMLRRMSTTDCKTNRRSSMGTFLLSTNYNPACPNRTINSIKNENRHRRMSSYWRSFEKYTPFLPPSTSFGTSSSIASCGEASAKRKLMEQFMAIHGEFEKKTNLIGMKRGLEAVLNLP